MEPKPLHAFRHVGHGVEGRVWPMTTRPGYYNVTLHDIDANQTAGVRVGIATEEAATALAKKWAGVR